MGDIDITAATVGAVNTRLGTGSFFTQNLFNKNHDVIPADATSVPLITTLPGGATTTALTGVKINPLSLTRAEGSWTPVDGGAAGYRVFLVNGSQNALVSRLPGT